MRAVYGLDRSTIHAVIMHIENDDTREALIHLHVEGLLLRFVPTASVNRAFRDALKLYKRNQRRFERQSRGR